MALNYIIIGDEGGSKDYNALDNKPSVNDVMLVGNKSLKDLGLSHPYISLERLRNFLYRVTFNSLPQDNGDNSPVVGGCSAYVANGKLYRNYDFNFDNAASFIVRTKDFEGMAMITGLNDGQMNDELIAQLPYRMVDGFNNNDIKLSVHILFNDWEWNGCGNKSIPLTSLPYEILSRVKSMATISTDLADVLGNLALNDAMGDYLLQVLVTDGTTTYAVIPPTSANQSYELVNATTNPKMSNFRYVNRAEVSRLDMDLQTRPTGIERFNAMPCDLAELRFTKAYETADRLSEFIGINGTTKASTDAELTAIYDEARAEYLRRERDGKTWQTMHSVVYGKRMKSLYIQENWNDNCVTEIGPALVAAVYGSTAFEDIVAALSKGRVVVARKDTLALPLAKVEFAEDEISKLTFSGTELVNNALTFHQITVDANGWSYTPAIVAREEAGTTFALL